MKQSIGLAYSLLELLELSEVLSNFMAAKICWNKDEIFLWTLIQQKTKERVCLENLKREKLMCP